MVTSQSIRFGLVMTFYGIVFQLPSGPSGMPQNLQVVIDFAKLIAWGGLAYGALKVAKQLHLIYQVFWVFLVEHRLTTADLWERRPDKREEFEVMLNHRVMTPKSRAAGAS